MKRTPHPQRDIRGGGYVVLSNSNQNAGLRAQNGSEMGSFAVGITDTIVFLIRLGFETWACLARSG